MRVTFVFLASTSSSSLLNSDNIILCLRLSLHHGVRFVLNYSTRYPIEFLPYLLRAKGYMMVNSMMPLSEIFNQYILTSSFI